MSIVFDNIDNFRDVGKTINDHVGWKVVREGIFFRSARLDKATAKDRVRIRNQLGIRTIVDLRNKKEQQKHQVGPTNVLVPGQIPGVKHHNIKVTGERFEAFLTGQLKLWSSLPLRALISNRSLPLLVHCALGKDRTGLIVALALMILGVPSDSITYDYQLSREALADDYDARLDEIKKLGLSPEWGGVADNFAERIEEHLDAKYGNLEYYLDGIGFGRDERARLVDTLSA
ncbi:putative tyrosine serine protein phosphatase protein [Daldinia childiae]|uniref:putative tyrosine serine protein phosphatase protein n=1 Tax=Daldinia childiae TaxID=326645 RepID=UPI00144504BA|nr:putative tyrosine serine protein phosphatase protein [Daldinia childiae]KAF3064573.1 putative tyrosine serine protein phosphatase protein [Daldinia childiae]